MEKKWIILSGIAVAVTVILGFYMALQWFQSLDASIAAAFITASLGLIGLWYAQWQSKTRDIAESHRTNKIEVYNIFFNLVEKYQTDKIDEFSDENIPEWLKEDFQKLNRGLILWASPGVIAAYLNFRTTTTGGGDILNAVDIMYREIRKDLGNSNYQLRAGDLIRIGLKDPNELK